MSAVDVELLLARTSIPWPQDAPELWNTVYIGGVGLPGICTVAVDFDEALDVKKPKNKSGATTTDDGAEPATVTVTCTCFSALDLRKLAAAMYVIRPNRRKSLGSPLAIRHPKTSIYGIDGVLFKKLVDEHDQKSDRYTVKFTFVEYFPPTTTTSPLATTGLDPRENALTGDLAFGPAVPTFGPPKPSEGGVPNP